MSSHTLPGSALTMRLARQPPFIDPEVPVVQDVHRIIADGAYAVAEWTTHARTRDGRRYDSDYAGAFRVLARRWTGPPECRRPAARRPANPALQYRKCPPGWLRGPAVRGHALGGPWLVGPCAPARSVRRTRMPAMVMIRASSMIPAATSNPRENPVASACR